MRWCSSGLSSEPFGKMSQCRVVYPYTESAQPPFIPQFIQQIYFVVWNCQRTASNDEGKCVRGGILRAYHLPL